MTHRRSLLTALVIAIGAATAPPAVAATTRYAAPGGMTSGPCTSKATACRLDRAIDDSVNTDGDTVIVLPGTHDLTEAPAAMQDQLTVQGEEGSARPLIVDNNEGVPLTVETTGEGTTLRHLRIRSLGGSSGSRALDFRTTGVVEDVEIEAAYECVRGAGGYDQLYADVSARLIGESGRSCISLSNVEGVTLVRSTISAPHDASTSIPLVLLSRSADVRDVVVATGGDQEALRVRDGSSVSRSVITGAGGLAAVGDVDVSDSVVRSTGQGRAAVRSGNAPARGLRLRNVTAIASGESSYGLIALVGDKFTPHGAVEARNLIVRGTESDVRSDGASDGCSPTPCTSGAVDIAYSNFRSIGGSGEKTVGAGNQSGDPRFVGADDFRLADDSPAIDAGTNDLLGPSALDGSPRVQGAAVDIGACERAAPPPPPPPPPGDAPQPPPPGAGPDVVQPFLSSVHATRRGTRIALTFVSSEAGRLRGTLSRVLRGRRRRGVCVTRRPRPKRGPLCEKRIVLRRFDESVVAGRNVLSLPVGRLRRGRYQLKIALHDRAGNVSKVRTLRFGVRKRGR